MTRLYGWLGGMFMVGAVLGLAYFWAHKRGENEGYAMCTKEYRPMLEARDNKLAEYAAEAAERARAVAQAQRDKAATEAALKRQLQEQSDAFTIRQRQLEANLAGAGRELFRLRDALATARESSDSLLRPIASPTGSSADGTPSVAERVIRECAERRVEMGGLAARLAEQVIGLQNYAKAAQRACGGV